MPATLVDISAAPEIPSAKRARQLGDRRRDANAAARRALRDLDLEEEGTELLQSLDQAEKASLDEVLYWERQASKATRQLRVVLANADLPEELRRHVVGAIHGGGAQRRDSKLLSETELDVIRQYRAMNGSDRQMVRTLFKRLAAAAYMAERDSTS